MIDGVLGGAANRDLGVIDSVQTCGVANLRGIARQAEQARVKERHVVGEMRRCVALGIDSDEQRLHRVAGGAKFVNGLPDRHQIGRADVGTEAEAEIDEHQLAAEIGVGTRLAGVIDERERTTDRLLAPHHCVHQLAGAAFALCMRHGRCKEQRRGQDRAGRHPTFRHAPMIRRTPVVETRSLSGICARTARAKLSPLQCIGITTSGSSFLISATT